MSAHFICPCGFACANLSDLFAHHDAAHGTIIEIATPKRGSLAVGKRRADDPFYAARDAAYDANRHDRAILADRRREARLLAAYHAEDEAC